jgi:hypothetical protein
MQAMVVPRVVEEVAVDAGIGVGRRVCLLLVDMASIEAPFVDPASILLGPVFSQHPEDRPEMVAWHAIGSEPARQILHDHAHRTHSYAVVVAMGSLTWAETDMPWCEQSRTPLLPNSGPKRIWPGRVWLGACRRV